MRILMSMFGWNDVGGGTSYPRQVAVDLAAQGHEVLVFYAAVAEHMGPYPPAQHRLMRHSEDGVQLVAVQDRHVLFLDNRQPLRELDHPAIAASFADIINDFQPDLVHFHNFLGLSASLIHVAQAAGVPSLFSAHNFWMICPTLYLTLPSGALCHGANAEGSNCQQCAINGGDPWTRHVPPGADYLVRRDKLRQLLAEEVDQTLVNSESVRELFLANGHAPERIHVQKLSNQRSPRIWEEVGSQRPRELPSRLRIGYIGQVIPIKGVHILVAAVQQLQGDFEVHIHGVAPEGYLQQLKALDQRQCVQFGGAFGAEEQRVFLQQIDLGVVTSLWFDHSPLVISEMQSAGIPVLGAHIGGIPDYLQSDAGRLFSPGSVDELATLLQTLLDDRPQLQAMKDRLRPPIPGETYLQEVLARYAQVLQAARQSGSPHYNRRIASFLQGRSHSQIYHAENLWPGAAANYGLDLHSEAELATLSTERQDLLAGASWRISPDPLLAEYLTQAGQPTAFVPLLSTAPPSANWQLPESHLPSVLVPIDPAGQWQAWLKASLTHLDPEHLPLLLPFEQDFDSVQEQLLAWFETQGIDPEEAPEMILLDTEQAQWPALFSQVDLVVLPQQVKTPQQTLLPLLLHSRALAATRLPRGWEALFEPLANSRWEALAHSLGQQLFAPLQDPEVRRALAHKRMQEVLDSQL